MIVNFNKTEISEISKKILEMVMKSKNNGAKIVALSGDLGSGKTTMTQELARQLGIKENVVSPTFVIMKIYNINSNNIYYLNFKKLIHIDAYRLDSYLELLKIGWQEIIEDKDNLIVIEWPEKIIEIIPKNSIKIILSHIDEEKRGIKF